jgi:hypothetical protein
MNVLFYLKDLPDTTFILQIAHMQMNQHVHVVQNNTRTYALDMTDDSHQHVYW